MLLDLAGQPSHVLPRPDGAWFIVNPAVASDVSLDSSCPASRRCNSVVVGIVGRSATGEGVDWGVAFYLAASLPFLGVPSSNRLREEKREYRLGPNNSSAVNGGQA